jgi:hypothetical protein
LRTLEEVYAEAVKRAKKDDFASDVAYWLKHFNSSLGTRVLRSMTERECICALCQHMSLSKHWCTIDKVKPVSVSRMTEVPKDCPYVLELTILG